MTTDPFDESTFADILVGLGTLPFTILSSELQIELREELGGSDNFDEIPNIGL